MKQIRKKLSILLLFALLLSSFAVLSACKQETPPLGPSEETSTDAVSSAEPPESTQLPTEDENLTLYPGGGSLLPTEAFYIRSGLTSEAEPGELRIYTSGILNDCVTVLSFDLTALAGSTTKEERAAFGNYYLRLFVKSVSSDAAKGIVLSAYELKNGVETPRIWSTYCGDAKKFVPEGEAVASLELPLSISGSETLLDLTDYIEAKLEKEEFSFTLALSDAKNRCVSFSFADLTAEEQMAPTLLFGEIPFELSVSADGRETDQGRLSLELKSSKPADGTLSLHHFRADGSLVKSYEKKDRLSAGKSEVVFTFDPKTVSYLDFFTVTYQREGDASAYEYAKGMLEMNLSDKYTAYLEALKAKQTAVTQTGIGKETYAEITAQCIAEYNRQNPLKTATVAGLDSTLQSFSRVLCSMAVLIDYGTANDITPFRDKYNCDLFTSYSEYKALFSKMMQLGCDAVNTYKGKDVLNFAAKELVIAYALAKDHFDAETVAKWAIPLKEIHPTAAYYSHASKVTNRNGYIMGGEQLRAYLGLADKAEVEAFINTSMKNQESHFDENGMYRDNYGEKPEYDPFLYDLTTRVQMQLISGFGYLGSEREELDEILRKGGLFTLFSTSAAGELPYGGRSNQYIFNMALIAANCEYEAGHYKSVGDSYTAGVFKRTAHLSITAIARYLEANKHIMNFFTDSTIGTESYGNYDKYMMTMSSFLAIAYLFADDTIKEEAAPSEMGGYVIETSGYFNAILASVGDYSIEILTSADDHYDSVGLGRIHKKGVYSALGLSSSLTAEPDYTVSPSYRTGDFSLATSWLYNGTVKRLSDYNDLKHTLLILTETADKVEFLLTYTGASLEGVAGIQEHYTLTKDGLTVQSTLLAPSGGTALFTVPTLETNGDNSFSGKPDVRLEGGRLTLTLSGETYTVFSEGAEIETLDGLYQNRNGVYRIRLFKQPGDTIQLHFTLQS